ncbi:LysM peptidoglycan-binding domain-containing M23 family metallopeptidase [Novosphingobium sp. 9]|uniref:LysM peptidoglycan-binding domain-containing M23 family metallopeptidase n=1 Tax=Novosphingobium sp. 9 TaxID=2025349 RepID=UPI0021B622CF|nr:LysM peptidoglycan-binding domain-containing M23 family metallopeptidase [Novosphingobium sp. 9]
MHVVGPGETLNGIANRAGVEPREIAEENGLEAPFVVHVGQKLDIPRGDASVDAERTARRVIAARGPQDPDASPAPAPQAPLADSHIVTAGETLSGIARKAGLSQSLIAEANGIAAPYSVRVGQHLILPRSRTHVVAAGETTFSIAYDLAMPWEQIATANNLDPKAPPRVGQRLIIPTVMGKPMQPGASALPAVAAAPIATPSPAKPSTARFAWPLKGAIRRGYSPSGSTHDGLDIAGAEGAPVRAAAAGTVVFAGAEDKYHQFGNLVVVDHGNGWATAYGFLQRVTVKQGETVRSGERVGIVGDTGLAKSTELHFEVRHDGKPVDPLDALPPAP